MSIADRIPTLRGRGKHSPDVVIGNLRSENVKLLNRQLAADDFFALLYQDVVKTNQAWEQEKERREQGERAIAQLEAAVELRDQEIADLKRRVDVGVKAEHVIAKTQPIPVVMPLHQSPMAATDPAAVLLTPTVRISTSGASADPGQQPAA
ncbi:hypothetical protein [Streptomyces sp. NPDC058066]|uniref:hypothetical protein n=1 Tax=Streptomyces sp. NPDC058066 TaxID=3346323 RepID=UPI0036E8E2AD